MDQFYSAPWPLFTPPLTEVAESLTGTRKRCIAAAEVKQKISELLYELYDDGLIDDMKGLQLPHELKPEGVMKLQLEIIDATQNQIERAVRSEWRARTQRHLWLEDNPAIYEKLTQYNNHLIEEWEDRWNEQCEKLGSSGATEALKKKAGRTVLEWSHRDAHKDVGLIKPGWSNPNLVQGTYQILSKDKSVGWHPDYRALINVDDPAENV